jgi:hypothetical protein
MSKSSLEERNPEIGEGESFRRLRGIQGSKREGEERSSPSRRRWASHDDFLDEAEEERSRGNSRAMRRLIWRGRE